MKLTTTSVPAELKFNSRETYIDWRNNWRQHYAKVSSDIRIIRRVQVEHCRVLAKKSPENYNAAMLDALNASILTVGQTAAWHLAAKRNELRVKAHYLIELLRSARVKAQEQYLAQHGAPIGKAA